MTEPAAIDWPSDGESFRVAAPDGASIAVFTTGVGPPLLLVHGATADHTTWRTSGPLVAERHAVFAVDRRGRGASTDGPAGAPYAIEREFNDLVGVADAVAARVGVATVDVTGHSYGGRIALGAALRSARIRRLVVYEGAPPVPGSAGYQGGDGRVLRRIAALVAAGDRDDALATFMREIVGMPEDALAAFRTDPIWRRRADAVETTVRELEGDVAPAASLDALGSVRQPVLQLLGADSPASFREATEALDARLRDGRVVTIEGARHAAHHSHAHAFVDAIQAFLAEPEMADSGS